LYEDSPNLDIRVSFDKALNTLTIADNGIGMSEQEAIDHLGTIAKSGTKDFMSRLEGAQKADAKEQGSLIGQFGVGFYSGYIVADKIVVMHDGIVEQMGAPLDLYDHPANLFVAGFIGSPSMNFVHGTVDEAGKLSATSKKGATLPLGKLGAAKPGQAIVYGIRPEHIHLSDKGVEAEVVVVEPTGSETQVVVRLKGEEMVCVFRERITAKPGETIKILPDPDLVHLFDAANGKRID
jgi:hypothetical protein